MPSQIRKAESVRQGKIAIIKHTDDGETKIETPEEGAVFAIYLKSTGSFDAAKETERDYLTCDENGFAQSKNMPYGVYTVHQVSGWEGRELMKDFDVFIAKDSEIYTVCRLNELVTKVSNARTGLLFASILGENQKTIEVTIKVK